MSAALLPIETLLPALRCLNRCQSKLAKGDGFPYPKRVAVEIARVIKRGVLLQSELPYMQRVHKGAYSFTRHTLSGHRRLFNMFSEVDAGMGAGAATALVWVLTNLTLAFVLRSMPRELAKLIVRVCYSWIKYLDHLLHSRPEAMNGAYCTCFLGRKSIAIGSDAEIIARHIVAKTIPHV